MARSRNTCLFMLMAYLRIKPPRPGLEPWTRHRRPPLPRDLSILGLLYVKEGICNNKKKREIGEKENLNESLVLLRIVLLGWTCCTRKNWEMGWMLCRGGGAVGVWLVNNWFPWINLFLSYHPPSKFIVHIWTNGKKVSKDRHWFHKEGRCVRCSNECPTWVFYCHCSCDLSCGMGWTPNKNLFVLF